MATDSLTKDDEVIHYYAGFPGKAMCLGNETPIGTYSTTIKVQITCGKCKKLLGIEEQVPADRLTTVQITDDQNKRALEFAPDCQVFPKMAARQIVYLSDQLTDLRASLAREENARKVLTDENERLRQRCNRLADTAMARTPV